MLVILTNAQASEKEKIIENLTKINSLKFNFTQISNNVEEIGDCIIVFPKKMHCYYEQNKEIIVNDDNLVLIDKKENKDYSYNIKDTPLGVILDKANILERLSKIETFNKIDKKIIAVIDINNQESIDIYFDAKKMNILGWKIKNYDKSSLEFLMENILINIKTKEKFEIPK
jgi:outer membrane lipoprotein-sorting protein